MSLTLAETGVVEHLRQWRIGTKKELCESLGVSHMTVVRALKKYGSFTSYNHNSAFYTLAEVPSFDADGLWLYREVGFSRRRTLEATLEHLVEGSPAGFTVAELEERLLAKVGNLLCRLCRKKRLSCFRLGRYAVYVARDRERREGQEAARRRLVEAAREKALPEGLPTLGLPEGFDALTVTRILVRMIQAPQASVASHSKTLQAQGLSVTAERVREVMAHYGLLKKTEP